MRGDLFERLMRIVARTGERHVLVDASLPEPLVILPLAAYEGLLGGDVPLREMPRPPDPPPPEPRESWISPVPEPASARAPAVAEDALNEEEKFYLEPID